MKTHYWFRNCIYVSLIFISLLSATSSYGQLAKCKGKYFGNIIQGSVRSNYNTYWNQATSENGSKWGSIEGTRGSYNWSTSDVSYNWAKNNNGLFKFHTLVWGSQTPGWVSSASTATLTTAIQDFIKACSTHYTPMGGLNMIDVLNEPVNTAMPGNMKAALTAGYQAEPANAADKNNQYGWAIWCFQLARKYFPDATLLINEYNVEMNWNNCRAPYIAMSIAIKNAPNLTDGRKNLIDGVGLQCHGVDNLTAANFKACIDEIWTKTALPVHITEFDQNANPNEAKQQSVYSTLIPVAWEHAHVAGITLWGYVQGTTWLNGNGANGPGGTDSGILYSPNYGSNPNGDRPAMTWLKQYLAGRPSLACCPAPAPFASCTNTNTPPTVSITAPANNASYTAPASVSITASASDADGTVSNVQFYSGSTLLGSDATSPYAFSWTNVAAGTYTITARATDNAGAVTTSTAITITVTTAPVAQTPFNGTPASIPGKIEAENYDLGGQGVAFNETTTGNSGNAYRTDDVDIEATTDAGGGYSVGWIAQNEWLEYTVNVAAGTYSLEARVASANAGTSFHVELDGVNISGPITVPNTGDWQVFQTVTIPNITLTAGQKIMRIAMDASWFNINYVNFTTTTTTPNSAPTVSITAPANNASYTAPASITITALASDSDGTVSNVQFFNGTTLLGTDATAPYSFTWTNVVGGTYTITAKATDNAGASTTSTAITVIVTTPPNVAPTVSITAPANNASYTAPASITITALASDSDGTVSNVQFFNGTTLLGTDATAPYSFTWTNVVGGTYTITAKATDNAGASTTSTAITVVVTTPPNVAPTVSITAPANNASYTAPASITISASASDSDGTVSNVQFYNGATLLGTDATAPYSFSWTNVAAGTYTITAKATDNAGASTTSAAITVVVNTPPIPVGDIAGPDCASKNSTVTFTLDPSKRTGATNYSWWVNGATQSITPVAGSPFSVNIQTGPNFVTSQVCVGVGYSGAPYYTSYCKTVTLCSNAKVSADDMDFAPDNATVEENVENITVLNMMGAIVYSGKDASVQVDNDFASGIYNVFIRYNSGRTETKKIMKVK